MPQLYKTIEEINKNIVEINTHLRYMRETSHVHDKKLENIDKKLSNGAGKIARNGNWLKAVMIAVGFLATLILSHIFG